jgi:hypothetical protein
MNEHRYILEPYKGMNTRYLCPNCQKKDKTFSHYIDTETGERLHQSVGRCNRESNCGYHYTPKQYFQDNNILFNTTQSNSNPPHFIKPYPKLVSFIPVDVFKASLNTTMLETNQFVQFLNNTFGNEITSELVSRYFIATSKHWEGATVFWQIDALGKIRTGKIMLYNVKTGKRVKEPYNHISWAHKFIKQPEFELKQCLFGEHLLMDKTKTVAIVESEKTAIIASVYISQFIWVAIGSLNNFNEEKCSILKDRSVVLFPDLNGFDKWNLKAKELSHIADFTVSTLLENKTSLEEKELGLDLADYLLLYDYKDFILPESEKLKKNVPIETIVEQKKFEKNLESTFCINKIARPKQDNWEQDIAELEHYFSSIKLPTKQVRLNQCSFITDADLFIKSHIEILRCNNGNKTHLQYLKRLIDLKQILENEVYL